MAESLTDRKARVRRIDRALARLYPEAHCELDYANPLQLLVATILSAQCTDARVNQVTPPLFARYPAAQDFSGADLEELAGLIRSTGFFQNKAKNIIGCCQGLVERFGGQVPGRLEDLVSLPGVGRKTANVILGNAFGIPGLTVDTHMLRLSGRLGLSRQTDPEKVEQDLMQVVPQKAWTDFSHRIIWHGRRLCPARNPLCDQCPLRPDCPAGQGLMPL